MSTASPPEGRWDAPSPYNYATAIDGMGTVSAPLLAGISLALAAIVLSGAHTVHFVSATLALLVVAAGSFVAAVECTSMARQYAVSPSDLEGWWPDHDKPERREMLRREQRYHRREFQSWSARARWAYDAGVLSLSLGVVALLVPHGGFAHASLARIGVIALATGGFVAEAWWINRTRRTRPEIALPAVGPEKPLH